MDVKIRKLESEDAKYLYEMLQDQEVVDFMPFGKPKSIDDMKNFIVQCNKKIEAKEDITLGIFDKDLDKIVGCVFLPNLDLDNSQAEIGLWLGKHFWGKGYNIIAIKQMIDYGFKELNLNRIWAQISTSNIRSIKTFVDKLGFVKEGILRQARKTNDGFSDMIICSLLKDEWGGAED